MKLARDQLDAFNTIESEVRPILVTGAAGTGKSALLRHLVEHGVDRERTVVAAFTGTAALNVGGITLHELALQSKAFGKSIQVFSPLPEQREIKKKKLDFLSNVRLLVIDEISMVRADMIDALDRVFRLAQDSSKPFGGIRLVMFGDPFQLPPFVQEQNLFRREKRFLASYEEQVNTFFHYAHVFSVQPIRSVKLYIPKRQVGQTDRDIKFIESLNDIRNAKPANSTFRWINKEAKRANFRSEMRLFPKRKDAAKHNQFKLATIKQQLFSFAATITSFDPDRNIWSSERDYPAPYILDVKVGAVVMVVANINISEGLVNGAVGKVLSIHDDFIEIELKRNSSIHRIHRHEFDRMGYMLDKDELVGDRDSDVPRTRVPIQRQIVGKYIQFPLILAWGVTIHKAQGATLDEVVIHFKESFKDPGQAYVALSRVRSIDGLGFIGKFQARHLKSFSFRHIRFVSGLDSDQRINSSAVVNKISFSDLEQAFLERTPWREVGWLQRVLEHYVDYVPAIKDNTGFNLRRRIVYLRDFTGIHPSQFLVNQANREGLESALDICRNLERSIRNKLPILRGDYAEGEFDEFCLDNYEISESNYRSLSWGRQDDKASLLAAVGQGRDVVPLEDLRAAQEADLQEIYWISKSGRQSSIEVSKSGRSWTYFDSVNSTGGVSINNDSLFFTMLDYRDDFDPRGCNEIYFKGSLSDTEACLWLRYMFSNLQDIQVTINGNYRGKYSALV